MIIKLEEIAKGIIEGGYVYAGIRTLEDDEIYKVGDMCRESYEWDLEHDCSTYYTTGETAGGTCATGFEVDEDVDSMVKNMITAIESNNSYVGLRQVVIAGNKANTSFAGDEDEVRIVDAIVVGIIRE